MRAVTLGLAFFLSACAANTTDEIATNSVAKQAGASCSVKDNKDGTKTIMCGDGTSVVVSDGKGGGSCSVTDNKDGTKSITCGDGASVTVMDSSGDVLEGSYTLRNSLDAAFLAKFKTITGQLWIEAPGLTNLELPALTSVGGALVIAHSTALTSLSGFSNLTSIGGNLSMYGNTAITDLSGFGSLKHVDGNIVISGNTALTDLSGFGSLTSVGGGLTISGNNALTSLSGLSRLTSVGGNLFISSNSDLPQCECSLLKDQLSAAGFTGSASISDCFDPCEPNPCGSGTCTLDCKASDDYTCDP